MDLPANLSGRIVRWQRLYMRILQTYLQYQLFNGLAGVSVGRLQFAFAFKCATNEGPNRLRHQLCAMRCARVAVVRPNVNGKEMHSIAAAETKCRDEGYRDEKPHHTQNTYR